MSILNGKGLVQPQSMTQLRDLSRRRPLSKNLLNGIPGHDVDQLENESQHEPQGRKREQESLEEVRAIRRGPRVPPPRPSNSSPISQR
jgi:hypothetical protein